ncbi:hypothetical protein F3K39_19100 [Streptomyces sp. LBUM 1479]|uniref:hypothetical protein n=1 Tax=Streptomyces scabiei TaxID=1930 RepID=UPI001B3144B3|nr:hypothetical protein [Streptomyces sp. LBUM 1475]MBP5930175.1 hypothetical protein [Streptomyces sp. LBUM 1479]QTU63140.1 hypothetical protein F3K22_20850 [Streptomyces sp. LBUM 1475]
MSDESTVDKTDEETGGEAEKPSRIAGGCVVVILAGLSVLVLKAVVTAAPYVAYVVVGILCTIGWQKARARLGRRRSGEGEEEEAPAPDVGEALRRLVGDDKGVLLTTLRDDLKLPDTKAVKDLLDEAGIPWKAGRTREGNGPSVRREHIPATSSPVADHAHGDGCCCRSGDNGNGNNAEEGTPEEGLHVEAIGQGGSVMYRRRRGSSRRHH